MITAEEARRKVKESIINIKEGKLIYVFENIQKEAESGNYELRLRNVNLEPDQIEFLKEQGYRVEYYTIDHGYQTILFIVWKNERE